MDTAQILTELRSERDRITLAITALEALNGTGKVPTTQKTAPASQPAPKQARRRMSAAGRKRIAEAARAMWARRKKEAKLGASASHAAPKLAAPKRAKRGITAAGRKRLSELAKARWAARRKAAAKSA